MKRIILSVLFTVTLSTTLSAQTSSQDSVSKKVVLTIQRHGESQDLSVEDYSFSFAKRDVYKINGQTMRGVLMVSLNKYSPFLLQAVGGDSTNIIQLRLTVYDQSGQKENSIQMNHALIRSTSTSYQKNYGTDISVEFAAHDIVVNGVKM